MAVVATDTGMESVAGERPKPDASGGRQQAGAIASTDALSNKVGYIQAGSLPVRLLPIFLPISTPGFSASRRTLL